MNELLAQVLPCGMGQIRLVVIARLGAHFTYKEFTYLLFLDMNGWHHNVAGFLMHQLKDALSQVTFYDFDAFFFQILVQPAFFRQHRLALDEMLHLMPVEDVIDNLAIFLGVFCPIDVCPIGKRVFLKLLQQLVQMAVAIHFQGTRRVAQLLPFGNFLAHFVPFGTNHPQRFIVPCRHVLILQELSGCFRMFRTHNPAAKI